jgi:hypothetical protein
MQATTDHPLDRVREARQTLIELCDHIVDADDDSQRGFALAEVIRHWNASSGESTWAAIIALIPSRPGDPVDEASEEIRHARSRSSRR